MANPQKGEVDFIVGDKTYTMKLGHNARATAEGLLGKQFPLIIGEILDADAITHETLIAVMFAALHQFQPELSLFDVGDLLDDVPDEYVGERLMEAMTAAAPKVSSVPPRKAKQRRAGTTT